MILKLPLGCSWDLLCQLPVTEGSQLIFGFPVQPHNQCGERSLCSRLFSITLCQLCAIALAQNKGWTDRWVDGWMDK